MNALSLEVLRSLQSRHNPEKAQWLENYVKHDVKSLGVGIPEIRKIIIELEKKSKLTEAAPHLQSEFLDHLMKQKWTETKLAAILFIQLYWKAEIDSNILKLSSGWFDNKWISDWNVCDWLCVRLLTPILNRKPALAVKEFKKWNKDPYLWKARASLVPFAQAKDITKHQLVILDFSSELIQREERFCKTAVGWVLRECSKTAPQIVEKFLEENSDWTTAEVLKNARKYKTSSQL